MTSIQEQLAILQALADGHAIEWRQKKPNGTSGDWEERQWKLCNFSELNFQSFEYRIKPEKQKPKEIWVNEYEKRNYGYSSKAGALAQANSDAIRKAVLYREVVEETNE